MHPEFCAHRNDMHVQNTNSLFCEGLESISAQDFTAQGQLLSVAISCLDAVLGVLTWPAGACGIC